MKKFIILLVTILTLSNLNAQIYNINFTALGTTATIDSVNVKNITQGTSLTMLGFDILQLGTVGINELNKTNNSMKVYPNPMLEQTELTFYAEHAGTAQITIYDVSGRKVLQTINNVIEGSQKYTISGLKQGVYFINVLVDNYANSLKILSLNTSQHEANITYQGIIKTEAVNSKPKSANAFVNMAYTQGDSMYYKAYLNNCYNVAEDVPTGSETITFTFASALPSVLTLNATSITSVSATTGGTITADGECTVTASGICYSIHTNTTLADSIKFNVNNMNSFSTNLTGLIPDTTYYVRAYATNSAGTAYGNEISFKTKTSLPVIPYNKVAYYSFDATPTGGQGKLPVTTFTDSANIVIMFEGKAWELSDSAHYGSTSSYILTVNPNYHYYKQIINDIKTLQARGVKVLWNIDDANSWNTTLPFTTYNGTHLNATQYAAFVKANIIDSLHLDGICLDIEHMYSTAANANYQALLTAFGTQFGPKSIDSLNRIYTAAIYDSAQASYAIGQSVQIASYMNFVMDMGYDEDNTYRFNLWANYIGPEKTMIGVSNQYNTLIDAEAAAAWEPLTGIKAGIMVYAANVNKPYTDTIFGALH